MSEWFERDEFWADFAPVLFGPSRWENTAAAVDKVLTLLELSPGERVLDLCCGPGRHSLELARRGYRPTGVDRTARYLDEARRRAVSAGLEVEWVQEDMRRFVRPEAFGAAINLFTSFGYFDDPEDDRRVARNLCASLRPGGKAILDVHGKETLARNFRERDWSRVDGNESLILLEERSLALDWSRLNFTWTLVGPQGQRSESLSLRLYSGTELAALLREAGFATVTLFGGLDGRPYDHRAERLVVVAATGA
jgi:SAM-dependent methyltransferase